MTDLAPAQDAETSLQYFLARQPILDMNLNTVGYELLYRSNKSNQASFTDGNHATANLLINTFAEAGLNQVVGASAAYIVGEAYLDAVMWASEVRAQLG